MKYFILITIGLITSFTAFSQATISGKIIDEKGEPVFGVNVSTDRQEGTVTDFDGNYKLDVVAGNLTLSISSIGFVVKKATLTIANKAHLKTTFTLIEELIEL